MTSQLDSTDLPPLFQAADKAAAQAQTRFLFALRAQLGLVILAAAIGAAAVSTGGRWHGLAFAGAAAFLLAIAVRGYLLQHRPERKWYEGRAAAESVKTLAWRYAVRARPFDEDKEVNGGAADRLFVERLHEILTDLDCLALCTPEAPGPQITDQMRRIRRSKLEDRKAAYQAGRLEDQRNWYLTNGGSNSTSALRWNYGLMAVEALGLVGALLIGTGQISIDLLGVAGAIAAAGAAWLSAKQHENLAKAYGIAANELASIESLAEFATAETAWSDFVDQAEEAISREHTLWRASRGDR